MGGVVEAALLHLIRPFRLTKCLLPGWEARWQLLRRPWPGLEISLHTLLLLTTSLVALAPDVEVVCTAAEPQPFSSMALGSSPRIWGLGANMQEHQTGVSWEVEHHLINQSQNKRHTNVLLVRPAIPFNEHLVTKVLEAEQQGRLCLPTLSIPVTSPAVNFKSSWPPRLLFSGQIKRNDCAAV